MGELFKLLKTYQKGGSPKLMIDWVNVPRKVRIKIAKEVLPTEYINKLEHLNLIDEIFNGDDVQNEITYKKRLERYLERYPDFNEFVFESCHWKNVRYDVNYKEEETREIYLNNFQYIYYALFTEKFPTSLYNSWNREQENIDKSLSDFVREIKFGRNRYESNGSNEVLIENKKKDIDIRHGNVNFLMEFDFEKVSQELNYYDYLISINDFKNEFFENFDYKKTEEEIRFYNYLVNKKLDEFHIEVMESNYEEYRSYSIYNPYIDDTDWSNYNDDLDMDQQSDDFWNQF